MQVIKIVISLALMFTLFGCASLPERIERIKKGDHKTKIIDQLGSPNRNERVNGTDVWTYHYQVDGEKQSKSFILFKGIVTETRFILPESEVDQDIKFAKDIKDYEKSIKKKRKARENDFKDLDEN